MSGGTVIAVPQPMDTELDGGSGRLLHRTWARDPRFSYAVFEPEAGAVSPGLLVVVHGSERAHVDSLNDFIEFARRHHLVVLSPLFPADVLGDGNGDGYKFLHEGDIRYDCLLEDMVDAVCASTGCRAERFLLHGYSGGGQFAHRYLMLRPERVFAASVGAPGEVTLADWEVEWWGGLRGVEALFGRRIHPGQLKGLPVLLTIGEHDDSTEALQEQPPTRFWPTEDARLQADRRHRLDRLRCSLEELQAKVHFKTMPRKEHQTGQQLAVPLAQDFFAEALSTRESEASVSPASNR